MLTQDTVKNIEKKLSKHDIPNYYELDIKTQKYIYEAEKAYEEVREIRDNALQLYKDNKLSVKFMAKKLGVERQTLYNHNIVCEYIKILQNEQSENDIFNKFINLQNKIREKEEDFIKLYQRDVTIEQLKCEIDSLNEKLIEKDHQINFYVSEMYKNESKAKSSKVILLEDKQEDL